LQTEVEKQSGDKVKYVNVCVMPSKAQSILHFLHVCEGTCTVRVMRISSSEEYRRTVHAPPDFCNRAYFVRTGRACVFIHLFTINKMFLLSDR